MLNSNLLSNVKLIAFTLDNTSLLTHMQVNSREQFMIIIIDFIFNNDSIKNMT